MKLTDKQLKLICSHWISLKVISFKIAYKKMTLFWILKFTCFNKKSKKWSQIQTINMDKLKNIKFRLPFFKKKMRTLSSKLLKKILEKKVFVKSKSTRLMKQIWKLTRLRKKKSGSKRFSLTSFEIHWIKEISKWSWN